MVVDGNHGEELWYCQLRVTQEVSLQFTCGSFVKFQKAQSSDVSYATSANNRVRGSEEKISRYGYIHRLQLSINTIKHFDHLVLLHLLTWSLGGLGRA